MLIPGVTIYTHTRQDVQQVSSPEAAELLMTALEKEAEREEEEERATEAQILEFADTTSPAGETTRPATVAAGEGQQLEMDGRGVVERMATWLPASFTLSPLSLASAGNDDVMIEDEILLAALRWIPFEEVSPSAPAPHLFQTGQPQQTTPGSVPAQAAGESIESDVKTLQAASSLADSREPGFLTQCAYSSEEEEEARQVADVLETLLADSGAEERSDGAGSAAAEELLLTQTVRVRHAVAASIAGGSTGGQVVEWMRARSALVLQLAYRCHRSRRVLNVYASRRRDNAEVDYERMARRLIEDLHEDPEDLFEFLSHTVSVFSQLPAHLASQVREVVRESHSPIPVTIRTQAAQTIR